MRLENEYGRKQLLGTKISSEHDWATPYDRKRKGNSNTLLLWAESPTYFSVGQRPVVFGRFHKILIISI